jgi:hypothetical protein
MPCRDIHLESEKVGYLSRAPLRDSRMMMRRGERPGHVCRHGRDFAGDLENNPEWQIEVTDESGKPIFRLSLLAESMR